MQNTKQIIYENGDILNWAAKVDVIGHQVNCFGVMGGGLALQIAHKWPDVLVKYQKYVNDFVWHSERSKILGHCQIIPVTECSIANLFGQYSTGPGLQTDYPALLAALITLKTQMLMQRLKRLALPVNLGCGLAGGDWGIVRGIIEDVFENSDIQVILVEYKA